MILMLHISDLHFVQNANAYNTEAIIFKEATEKAQQIPLGEKLLIVTGDFHNFTDKDYEKANIFVPQLCECMGIDIKQDVFIIPGNHDVGNEDTLSKYLAPTIPNWKLENRAFVQMLKQKNLEYVSGRLRAFRPYNQFAQGLGIYDVTQGEDYPSETHVRNWRGKLNILHLNTALIADGTTKTGQITDTTSAASNDTWKGKYDTNIPAIAIGHNNYYDLDETQRRELATTFALRNVSAYLCGDTHLTETNPERQMIRLESGHHKGEEIPNIVAARGIADGKDLYSEVGFCWHQWDENTGEVSVVFRKWTPFNLAKTTKNGEDGQYFMRRC